MSASDKKKLRKEENMAKLTERQQTAQKEAKKLKVNTIVFVTVIALVLCIGIGMIGYSVYASSGLPERNTTAVQIGEHKLSAAELNYFYIDNLNQLTQDWYSMYLLQYEEGFKPSVALDQQQYKDEEGKTWADHFADEAIKDAAGILAMCDTAKEKGYTMTEADNQEVEDTLTALETQGMLNGFGSLEEYLQAMYGNGAQEKTFRAYLENMILAQSYYTSYTESLSYTDQRISDKDAETPGFFSSYDYTFYKLSADTFMEHTHNEDGEEEHNHSEEDVAAALTKAEEVAKELVASGATNKEELDAAIANLEMYKSEAAEETTEEATDSTEEATEPTVEVTEEGIEITEEESEENGDEGEETTTSTAPTSTKYSDYDYSYIPVEIAEWLAAEDRKAGDIGYVAVHVADDDGKPTEELEAYYVVILDAVNEHPEKLVSARHILVKFEGGSEDEETGETVYSEEEQKAASDEAERIKAEFEAGEKTAEAFGELAKKYSDDNAEDGGLYEDIYPGQMEADFDAWCFDAERKPGDTGIVKTSYGYHVMYFVETQEETYRQHLITSALRTEESEAWFIGLQDGYMAEAKVSNTSYLPASIVLSN